MVSTALVMVLDGDLLPQTEMRAKLAPGTQRGDALLQGAAAHKFYVLPSFDTRQTELAYAIAGGAQPYQSHCSDIHLIRGGTVESRFKDMLRCPKCHASNIEYLFIEQPLTDLQFRP